MRSRSSSLRPSGAARHTGFKGRERLAEQYKPLINDGRHRVQSAQGLTAAVERSVLQLRKRRIEQVILAGMSANLCVESHLRELLNRVRVRCGRCHAAPDSRLRRLRAAITNFRFLASDLWSTGEAAQRLAGTQVILEPQLSVTQTHCLGN